MNQRDDILCIGSVLWDVIGRTDRQMVLGNDVPGRITRLPGGVAMNIAMGLARVGLRPVLLTAIGLDGEGEDLLDACAALGLDTRHVHRAPGLPTDRYMAVESPDGLIAAIADAHSLEAVGDAILAPLEDGRLGSDRAPWPGMIALDGNLTEELLGEIANRPSFAAADLRIAPASPGKAARLRPLIGHPGASFYLNIEEAGLVLDARFTSAPEAAAALVSAGVAQVLVTDGARAAAEGTRQGVVAACPPTVTATRITGAGDTFMAAHIAAQAQGAAGLAALETALAAAATYVAGA
ncbi:PfkB family carbohydrate kinase [Maritimibacter sp. HL-12]|uniref:PfkB family carbohydrate kinase n=1 Tax=Maritimibacter sp. HL-12 TaxID=1162418 RepID=UPI000A0F071A|nr:PfkB family carbohydrate kinase [Maritimibacter sp. HL-12]SMH57092.1 Sugar or nucleoside kinase, ribokinase family [Maritimibacter sp. HL-12]